MAGMNDYRFYTLNRRDSPFWERKQNDDTSSDDFRRTSELRLPSRTLQLPQSAEQLQVSGMGLENAIQECSGQGAGLGPGLGAGLAALVIENLVSHPFVVLRRQCQVHVKSRHYHIISVTLLPVVLNLHRRQGLTTLWKGIGSVFVVHGMTLAVEDFISKFTPWPKEISCHSSMKMIGQHLLLKCLSIALVTPFFSASLVETVQSEIASEKPGVFDVFKEGLCRMLSWSAPHTGRLLPVWVLVVPTVCYSGLQYILSTVGKAVTMQVMRMTQKEEQRRKGAVSKDPMLLSETYYYEITATVVGHMIAEAVLFPLETVLHRLHLQGTRTIIDNLDTGREVTPIMTSYEGVRDCFRTAVSEEGTAGLFKGFGSLIMQYALHLAVIKIARFLIQEVAQLMDPPQVRYMQSDAQPAVQQTTVSAGSVAGYAGTVVGSRQMDMAAGSWSSQQSFRAGESEVAAKPGSSHKAEPQSSCNIYSARYN